MLEFLGLPENTSFLKKNLENKIIDLVDEIIELKKLNKDA